MESEVFTAPEGAIVTHTSTPTFAPPQGAIVTHGATPVAAPAHQNTVVAPPHTGVVTEPGSGFHPLDSIGHFFSSLWNKVMDDPLEEDVAKEIADRETAATPATGKKTDFVKESNDLYKNVKQKLKYQFPLLTEDKLPIIEEMKRLGKELKPAKLEDGTTVSIWKDIKGYVPDQDWLRNQGDLIATERADQTNDVTKIIEDLKTSDESYIGSAFIPIYDLIPGIGRPIEKLVSPDRFKLDKNLEMSMQYIENENNQIAAIYKKPLLTQNITASKYTAVYDVDQKDPMTFDAIGAETAGILKEIPTDNQSKQMFRTKAQIAAIDVKYYNNPSKAQVAKSIYALSPEDDYQLSKESQEYYADALSIERASMTANINTTQKTLDNVTSSIAVLQKNIETNGYKEDWKENLDKLLALKPVLESNIQAKDGWLDFYKEEENTAIPLYRDYKKNEAKTQRLAELSPATVLAEAIVSLPLNVPGRISAVIGRVAKVGLLEAQGVENAGELYDLRSEETTTGFLSDPLRAIEKYGQGNGLAFGTKYTGIKPKLLYDTPEGERRAQSVEEATAFALLDDKGDWKFTFNAVPLIYTTGKVAMESYLLGGAMAKSETAFAGGMAKYSLASKLGKDFLTEGTLLKGVVKGALGVEKAGWYAAESLVGSMVPSVLLFGDEMIKQEIKNGLSYHEALKVGVLRGAIEGFTERMFPNEMLFYKQLAGQGAIKSFAKLAEDVAYRNVIERAVLATTGKKFTEAAYKYVFLGVKGAAETWAEESAEEVGGDALNQISDAIAKSSSPQYRGHDFTWANEFNTVVSTVATMLPMGYTSGRHSVMEYNQAQQAAQYQVGSSPAPYIQKTLELVKTKAISKEEGDRRLNAINKLSETATLSDTKSKFKMMLDPELRKLTGDQVDAFKQQTFRLEVKSKQLQEAMTTAPTEEELLKITEAFTANQLELSKLYENGPFANDSERVKNAKANLDFYSSKDAINSSTNLKALKDIQSSLFNYSKKETDPGLKAGYTAKSEQVKARILQLEKAKADAKKTTPEKAVENNASGTIKVESLGSHVPINLEFGPEYHLTQIEELPNGVKIYQNSKVKIVKDNGDSTVTIAVDGEAVQLPIEDLAKFKFTKVGVVASWRAQKSPRAFIFDNLNNWFSYTHPSKKGKPGKTITGRIAYSAGGNSAVFHYKEGGKVKELVLYSDELEGLATNKGPLKLLKDLSETQEAFEKKQEAAAEGARQADFKKLQGQTMQRLAFLVNFIENKKESLKTQKKIISSTEDLLLDVEIEMKALQDILDSKIQDDTKDEIRTKQGKIRKNVLGTFEALGKLQAKHDVLTKALADLALEQEDIERNLEYLKRYEGAQFESSEKLSDQLLDDLIDLDEQRILNEKSIGSIGKLILGIESAIHKIAEGVEALFNVIKRLYPDIKIDFSKENVIRNTPNYARNNPEAFKEVNEFNEIIANSLGRIKVKQEEVDGLRASIKSTVDIINGIEDNMRYQEELIKAAEKKEEKFRKDSHSRKIQSYAEKIFKALTATQSGNFTGDPEDENPEDLTPKSAAISLGDLFNSTTSGNTFENNGLDKPDVNRFQTFLNTIANPFKYSLLVVTKDNAKSLGLEGINFATKEVTNTTDKESDNDIVLVIVNKETLQPIDKDGNEIVKGGVSVDNVVYTSMRLVSTEWSNGTKAYVNKTGLTGKELADAEEAYKLAYSIFRQYLIDGVKNKKTPNLEIRGVSRGFDTQKNTAPQAATIASGLPSTVNLSNTQVIQIPKANDKDKTGSVEYQAGRSGVMMPKGRAVFSYLQHFFFLNNKRFKDADILNFQKVFKYLYDNINNAKEFEKARIYLEKTLYIRDPATVSPITDTAQTSLKGRSQIWFSQEENGNINIHLGTAKFAFNFEDDNAASFMALEAFFLGKDNKGIFHNVDNRDLVGKQFTEFYTEGKTLKERVWNSYQEYLISDKLPNGAARPVADIPLTTTLAPSTETTPNKYGRYISYGNPSNEKVTGEVRSKKKVTTKAAEKVEKGTKAETAPATNAWTESSTLNRVNRPDDEGRLTFYRLRFLEDDGKTTKYSIIFSRPNGETVIDSADMGKSGQILDNDQLLEQVEYVIKGSKAAFQRSDIKLDTAIVRVSGKSATAPAKLNTPTVKKSTTPIVPAVVPTVTPASTTLKGKMVKKVVPGKGKNLRVAQLGNGYKHENLEIAKAWWEARFPKIPFNLVQGLIDGVAWGAIHDKMVSLSDVAEEGTIYHEAFEAVHKYFLNDRQLVELRAEFRSREGSFIEYATGKKIQYSEATDYEIKEELSEEYRKYEMSNGTQVWEGQHIKKSLFSQIFDFIHDFLFGDPATVRDVFEKISNAKYKDSIPFAAKTTDTEYREALEEDNPVLYRDIMNSITNLLFSSLRDADVNISKFLLDKSYNIEGEYKSIKNELDLFYGGQEQIDKFDTFTSKEDFIAQVTSSPEALDRFIDEMGDLGPGLYNRFLQQYERVDSNGDSSFSTQALVNLYDIIQNYKYLDANWDGVKDSHKYEYLRNYKIEFSESDEEFEVDEDEVNPNDYAQLGRKVNTNTEVKLLLATLIEQEYTDTEAVAGMEEVQPKLNSMLLSQVVDYTKVAAKLQHRFSTVTDFASMEAILRRMAAVNPTYQALVDKLKLNEPVASLNEFDIDLRNKFYISLNNMLPESVALSIDSETLSGSSIDLNEANAIRLIKDKWLNDLRSSKLVKHIEEVYTSGKNKGQKTGKVALAWDKSVASDFDLAKERDIMRFLDLVKFKFDIPFSQMTSEEVTQVREAVRSLQKVVNSEKPDVILYNNKATNDSLDKLARVYIKYSDFYIEAQHQGIDGSPRQNVLLSNFVGYVTKVFNSVKSYTELVTKLPQYTKSLENPYQSYSQILGLGTRFFNSAGERIREIKVKLFSGAKIIGGEEGTITTELAVSDYVAQEFSHNLEGDYYILITADSVSEWGLGLGHFVSQDKAMDNTYVLDVMKKYLASEILAAQEAGKSDLFWVDDLNKKSKSTKTHTNSNNLRQFSDILKSANPDFTLDIPKNKTPEQIIEVNKRAIDEAILDFIQKEVDATYTYFTENKIITDYRKSSAKKGQGSLKKKTGTGLKTILFAPKSFIKDGLNDEQVKDLIRFREINYMMAMIEQHKLLWGDPAHWADPMKRIKPFLSVRNSSIHGAPYFNEWHNMYSNTKTFMDKDGVMQSIVLSPGDIGYLHYTDNFKVQTFKNPISVAKYSKELLMSLLNANSMDIFGEPFGELTDTPTANQKVVLAPYLNDKGDLESPYESNDEADSQSWATYPGYQEMRRRYNSWTAADNELFEWDMALFRTDNSLYPAGQRGKDLKAYDKHLIDKGNPYLNRAMAGEELPVTQVIKPIYSGPKNGNTNKEDTRKTSVANLSWRLVKGTAMEPIYIAHMKAGTTLINVESANRVGLLKGIKPLYSEDGTNTIVEQEELSYKYWGTQVETKTQKQEAGLGTQVSKLGVLNLMMGGVPLDFIKGYSNLSRSEIKSVWNSLTTQEKAETSNYYKLVRNNNRFLAGMKIMAKNALFTEFGIESKNVEGKDVLEFKDYEKFADMLQNELVNRDAPNNLKDAVKLVDGVFQVKLDFIIGSDKLESLITSAVDKKILRPKMFGGQMPQVSSTLLEAKEHSRELVYKSKDGTYQIVDKLSDLSEKEKKSVRITSNDLHMYKPETVNPDGTISPAEPWIGIKLPFYMKEFITQGVELKLSDIPDELKWAIGFRIPTQEMNSIDHIKIEGFLPVEYGNAIVVPTELPTKAGSDFDIDKLNLYLYNYTINAVTNRPEKIKYLDNSNSTTKQRYKEYIKEMSLSVADDVKDTEEFEKIKEKHLGPIFERINNILDKEVANTEEAEESSKAFAEFKAVVATINNKDIMHEIFDIIKRSRIKSVYDREAELDRYIKTTIEGNLPLSEVKKLNSALLEYGNYISLMNEVAKARHLLQFAMRRSAGYKDFQKQFTSANKEMLAEFIVNNDLYSELPFKKFENLPIELQNSKKALENGYIDNLRTILSLEENFANLVRPNSAKVLEDEAIAMNNLWGKPNAKRTFGSYLSSLKNAFSRMAFLVGKAGVAVGAASQTLHAISQVVGAEFWESASSPAFSFPTNSYLEGDKRIYEAGGILTTDKKSISSIISAFIDAFVDVAKKPFILDINGNVTTAGIYITAVKLGMPIKEVVRWFSQPVIREYIKEVEKTKSVSYSLTGPKNSDMKPKALVIKALGEKYGFQTNYYDIVTDERTENYTSKELEGYIKDWVKIEADRIANNETVEDTTKKLSKDFSRNQANLLKEFMKLEGISWDFFRYGMAVNHDTKKTSNFDAIRKKMGDIVSGLYDRKTGRQAPFHDTILRVLNDTFIGPVLEAKNELLQGVQPLFLTENELSRQILNPIMNGIFLSQGLNEEKKIELAKNMRREFVTYLLHTIPLSINGAQAALLTSSISKLFMNGAGNISQELRGIQKQIEDNHLQPNFLVESLLGVIPAVTGKVGDVYRVKATRGFSDKMDSDHATADWRNLSNHPLTESLTYELIKSALLQSGIKTSPGSISQLIPNEIFADIAKQVEDYFKNPDIIRILNGFERSYYQNNWWNRDLIPKAVIKLARDTQEEAWSEKTGQPYMKTKYSERRDVLPGVPPLIFYWAESVNQDTDKASYPPGKFTKQKYLFYSEMVTDDEGNPAYSYSEREEMKKKGDYSYMNQYLYKRVETLNDKTGLQDVPLFMFNPGNNMKYASRRVAFYAVARLGRKGEVIEHYAEPTESQVNPEDFPFMDDARVMRNLRAAGDANIDYTTDRYLSSLANTKLNEEFDDISLSLSLDIYNDLENEVKNSYMRNTVLFEGSKKLKSTTQPELPFKQQEVIEQPIQNKEVKGENITSKGSEFAKKLTNVGNSVGLIYKGKEYVNSEHAYQTWKSGEFNQAGYNLKGGKVRGGKIGDTFSIMTDILTEKLKQHPDLVQGINERGGLEYLQKSTHNVIGDKFWESTGQNKFIEALTQAYKNVNQSTEIKPNNIKVISEPYGVVTTETNPSESKTQEFVNVIQPQIQKQAYKENNAATANDMFMYGLRWTRKGKAKAPINNRSYANGGKETTNALSKDGYVYDTLDQNGKPLAPLSELQPIISEIEKSLGIDMSDYDAVIGNIYLPGQNIATHRDTTESLSARNYPVIVYTIGNDSGISVYENEKNPGSASFASNKKITIPTKNGSIYTFGMDGKGRFEVAHDTPKNIKRDVKFPPITMPNGKVITNYTITLTFRRAADLDINTPVTPKKLTSQPTEIKPKIDINKQKGENLAQSKFYYDTTISQETRDFIQTLVKNFPKIASQIKIIDNKAAWNQYVGEDAEYMGYFATDENGIGYILLNRGRWAKTDTLAHEMLHAFTHVILDNPETQLEKDYVKNLTILFNQFKELKEAKTDYEYQANDINEFLAYSLTNKEFQNFLKSKFPKEQKSLFQQLVDLIKSLFGNKIEKSYLEKITNLTEDIINKSDYKNYKSRIQLINSQFLEGKGELTQEQPIVEEPNFEAPGTDEGCA